MKPKCRNIYTPLTPTNIHNALRLCRNIELQDAKTFRLFQIPTNKPIEAKLIYETI